jgi:hypothetical protein
LLLSNKVPRFDRGTTELQLKAIEARIHPSIGFVEAGGFAEIPT